MNETPLIFPPGMKPGCLYRGTAFGKVFAPMADKIKVLSWEEIRKRAGEEALSNRPYVKQILNQGRNGSCAAEQTAQNIMTNRVKGGQQHVLLNPLSIYHTTSGGRDQGSNVDSNLKFAQDHGCLPEAVWPRSKGFKAKPPKKLWDQFGQYFKIDEAYDAGDVQEIATGLIEQYTFGFGWKGHSCMLTELLDEDTAEYANSWKYTWGDKGFGIIKLRSINFGYGAWGTRTTTICPQSVLDLIVDMAAYNLRNAG